MIGKRADHGHVDLFPPFNDGLKDNLNLKYNWQTGIPNVSIWEERELFFFNDWQMGRTRAGRFFWTFLLWADQGQVDLFQP
jgi:hypothetical protein